MDILNNLKYLRELDDASALLVIETAFEEIDQLLDEAELEAGGQEGSPELPTEWEHALLLERTKLEAEARMIHDRAGLGDIRKGEGDVDDEAQSEASGAADDPGATDRIEERQCAACLENFCFEEALSLTCGYHYCRECLTEFFTGAAKDETRYPPRCCQPISHEGARPFLSLETMCQYQEKRVEWNTKDRIYCSRKKCSAFISPEYVRGKEATCSKCQKVTCSKCKKSAHGEDTECSLDEEM